ncbi:uncharacterized protein LOC124197270 [Daphnia pulex]|uniref:uncharacterized protein LOC124197270 n=1 Tax=Daphnia pulex TaxID=6669 RepID=UPI001EDEF36B|nr:uncharacterized protein LOC124197270 [Daphnia pulex]
MGLREQEINQVTSSSALPLTFGPGITELGFKERILIKWGDTFKDRSTLTTILLLLAYFFHTVSRLMGHILSPYIFGCWLTLRVCCYLLLCTFVKNRHNKTNYNQMDLLRIAFFQMLTCWYHSEKDADATYRSRRRCQSDESDNQSLVWQVSISSYYRVCFIESVLLMAVANRFYFMLSTFEGLHEFWLAHICLWIVQIGSFFGSIFLFSLVPSCLF